MLSCLRTGDEQSAGVCLERLTERFGAENERLMALRGLFQEAIAKDDATLKQVLEEYETILTKDPSNMVGVLRRGRWAFANDISPCRSAESRC
jgi:ER membrane protein complex subunit 2